MADAKIYNLEDGARIYPLKSGAGLYLPAKKKGYGEKSISLDEISDAMLVAEKKGLIKIVRAGE